MTIRVLIVDDSALVRQMLREILNSDPAIEVVGVARDPFVARAKIKELDPDVLTLDVEMPQMDGVTFLEKLMRLRPMPVVMVSSLTEAGADVTLRAMELGAVVYASKPTSDLAHTLKAYACELFDKVTCAATGKFPALTVSATSMKVTSKLRTDTVLPKKSPITHFKTTDRIVALGASTGGTEAIKEILMALPADAPGMVITQHIPAAFSAPFAKRMNSASAMTVCEAGDGDQILAGHVYIAPGDQHLLVERDGARYVCRLNSGPPVNRHRPAVNVMFRSVAQNAGGNAIGVILTGMGDDGATGLKELRDAGARTFAQDEATSVVFGMPQEAWKRGAAESLVALEDIPGVLLKACRSTGRSR